MQPFRMRHVSAPSRSVVRRVIALTAVAIGCGMAPTVFEPLPPGGHHVLFIGNSLTYTNDLPGTLSALAHSAGDTIHVRSVANPNFAVIDHALGGSNAVGVIQGEHWTRVVLQQGPTPAGLDRDTLILAARVLDPYVRAAGARTIELMTWPSVAQRERYPRLFDETSETCRLVADAVQGLCVPAGDVWRTAWAIDAQLPLYGPDGYHPAPLGTYLTAIVLYEGITGHDARILPARAVVEGRELAASEATVRLLQRVTHESLAREGGTSR